MKCFSFLMQTLFDRRLTGCLCLFFCLFSTVLFSQHPLATRLDFSVKQQTIPESLLQLSQASGTQIAFSNNDFSKEKYSFQFQQKTLRNILKQLLQYGDATFVYQNEMILVFKKETQKITISGYVEDAMTGERLISANIYEPHSQRGTLTNEYGFFSFTLPDDQSIVHFSYLGYHSIQVKAATFKTDKSLVSLKPSLTLAEVIVTAKDSLPDAHVAAAESIFSDSKTLEKLPSLGGEIDILRLMQQLPGVQSGTDGLGGIHVRGGNADQNLVLLDGVPIYNPYHALGLFSIFDHQIVRKASYYRGQFPARFGGRISSVIDVRTKEGNNKELHFGGKVGLIASKLFVEGPLVKEKGAFFISARRSHLDPFLKSYSKRTRSAEDETGFYNYSFGEIIAKVNYSISPKDQLYFSFYSGKDDYKNDQSTNEGEDNLAWILERNQKLKWGNTLGVLRWNRQLGDKWFANATATYSNFNFNSDEVLSDRFLEDGILTSQFSSESIYHSRIENQSLKADFDYVPNSAHYVRMGMTFSLHDFRPGLIAREEKDLFEPLEPLPSDTLKNVSTIKVTEWNAYLEDEWNLNASWRINAGVFASYFLLKDKTYFLLDPRFTLNWQAKKSLDFYVSVNRMSQYLHVLTRSGSGFPTDLWVPSTSEIKPQRSWMQELGFVWKWSASWSLATSAYWKQMDHLINYVEGADFDINSEAINSNNWQDRITSGQGKSKGLEWMLKKEKGKATGWISYTLSKTTRQFPDLNQGEVFPFRLDLRHVFNWVGIYSFDEQWSVSATWAYKSGSWISLARNEWQYIRQDGQFDFYYLNFGKKNSYQLPDYHRLDLACKYQKKKNWGTWSFDLGIYNVYNRRNVFYIKPDYNQLTQERVYKSVSLIPVLPYFSVNLQL